MQLIAMETAITKKITSLLHIFLIAIIFALPLFFAPFTLDWFGFNKQVLFVSATVIGYLMWALRLASMGEVRIIRTPLDLPLLSISFATLLALIFAPSPIISLLSPVTWVLVAAPLFYFLLVNNLTTQKEVKQAITALVGSSLIIALFALYHQGITVGLWTSVFPEGFSTPAGSFVNATAVQLISLALAATLAILVKKTPLKLALFGVALVLLVSIILKNPFTAGEDQLILSFPESWQIAIEAIKANPISGSGPGKYVEQFNQYRPASFNQRPEWEVTFSSAAHSLLQITTEVGLVGLIAFVTVLGAIVLRIKTLSMTLLKKTATEETQPFNEVILISLLVATIMATVLFVVLPFTTITLFSLLVAIALLEKSQFLSKKASGQELQIVILTLPISSETTIDEEKKEKNDILSRIILGVTVILSLCALYGLGRVYTAEVAFNESLKAAAAQNGTETYRWQQKAISNNPRAPRYHAAYASTNLSIATALASNEEGNITEELSRNIGILINQAVREARRAVTLAPNNAGYWENMGNIYKELRGVADGADRWAVTAYSQAVKLNPVNPRLPVELGGLYYSAEDYENASQAFQDAIRLKDDYANAYYNLAWTFQKQGKLPQAIAAMERVLQLTDQSHNDFATAENDLIQFRSQAIQQGESLEETVQNPDQDVLGSQAEATPPAQPEEATEAPSEPPEEEPLDDDQEESTSSADDEE